MTRVRRERGGGERCCSRHGGSLLVLLPCGASSPPPLVVISAKDPTQMEKAAAVGLAPAPPESAHPPPAPVPCGGEFFSLGCRPQQAVANIHSARKGSSTHTPSRLISQSRPRPWRARSAAKETPRAVEILMGIMRVLTGWRVVRFVSLRCAAPRAPRGAHHRNNFLRRALRAFQKAPL